MIESSFIRWILRNTARNITEKNNLQNITNFFYEKGWSMGLTITCKLYRETDMSFESDALQLTQ